MKKIKISQPYIDKTTEKSILKTIRAGIFSESINTKIFEKKLAEINKTKFAIATSSATAALHSVLEALCLDPGSEVITTPLTFIATANSILMAKLKPVFVDINEKTFNIDEKQVERKISKKTKAILAVDLYGLPCNYDALKTLAKKNKIYLISDSSQAIGAQFEKKPIAKFTDATVFSFYATKNITTGEGGAVITNDQKIADFVRSFKNHGRDLKNSDKYNLLGYNYRITEIGSVMGLNALKYLNRWTKMRQKNAAQLSKALINKKGLITPTATPQTSSVFHQYTVRITKDFPDSRNHLLEYLKTKGIDAKVYYPRTITSFGHLKSPEKFPIAEKISTEILSLPIHPKVTQNDIAYIAKTILSVK